MPAVFSSIEGGAARPPVRAGCAASVRALANQLAQLDVVISNQRLPCPDPVSGAYVDLLNAATAQRSNVRLAGLIWADDTRDLKRRGGGPELGRLHFEAHLLNRLFIKGDHACLCMPDLFSVFIAMLVFSFFRFFVLGVGGSGRLAAAHPDPGYD